MYLRSYLLDPTNRINVIRLPTQKVWKPDTILMNKYEIKELIVCPFMFEVEYVYGVKIM